MSQSSEQRGETIRLAEFCATTEFNDLDDDVVDAVGRVLVDTLAACYAGTDTEAGGRMCEYVAGMDGMGEATVVGDETRSHPQFAALANGTTAHALDVDDGHRAASAHPGAAVIPAALATAERVGASGEAFVTAVALGYETMLKTAVSVQTSHRERHFHATATCGCFGAAAAVASLLDLDAAATADAFGLAGSQAGGLFEFLAKGSEVKRFHAGRAAMAGILAGELAATGYDGPDTVIEGTNGFAEAFADEYDLSPFDELGEPWEVSRSYLKPYPNCRHIHGPIDVVKEFREAGVRPADVESIRVETYRSASYHDKRTIENLLDAQMSMPYGVAVALHTGDARLPQFTDYWDDETVRSLMERVEVVQTDEMESRYSATRPATVVLTTTDGEVYEEIIEYPLGAAENPMADTTLRQKFTDLTADVLDEESRRAVVNAAFDVASVDDVAEFTALL